MKPSKIVGIALLILGLSLFIFIYYPVLNQEIKYNSSSHDQDYQVVSDIDEAEKIKSGEIKLEPTTIVPVDYDFTLVVPKLGINTRVIPNVDSSNQDIYLPALKKGAAHALNSSLPNQPGPVYIFGHSTDSIFNISSYNAVFFLLRKLEPGDDIYIFYNQNKYSYKVTNSVIIKPDEITEFVLSKTENVLLLQTCSPPGTTINRLIVEARNL